MCKRIDFGVLMRKSFEKMVTGTGFEPVLPP